MKTNAPFWHRTKIVCALGPATDLLGVLARLIGAGMDMARIKASHGKRAACAKQFIRDRLIDHKNYVHRYGQDMPEIRNWRWNARAAAPSCACTISFSFSPNSAAGCTCWPPPSRAASKVLPRADPARARIRC